MIAQPPVLRGRAKGGDDGRRGGCLLLVILVRGVADAFGAQREAGADGGGVEQGVQRQLVGGDDFGMWGFPCWKRGGPGCRRQPGDRRRADCPSGRAEEGDQFGPLTGPRWLTRSRSGPRSGSARPDRSGSARGGDWPSPRVRAARHASRRRGRRRRSARPSQGCPYAAAECPAGRARTVPPRSAHGAASEIVHPSPCAAS